MFIYVILICYKVIHIFLNNYILYIGWDPWVVPLPTIPVIQDENMFSREYLKTFICHWNPGRGEQPNTYIYIYIYQRLMDIEV